MNHENHENLYHEGHENDFFRALRGIFVVFVIQSTHEQGV